MTNLSTMTREEKDKFNEMFPAAYNTMCVAEAIGLRYDLTRQDDDAFTLMMDATELSQDQLIEKIEIIEKVIDHHDSIHSVEIESHPMDDDLIYISGVYK